MINAIQKKTKIKKHGTSLRIVEVEYAQVPDAEERLKRVFKILLSSFENIEKNEAKRR